MGDVEARIAHRGEHGFRRRGGRGQKLHLLRQLPLHIGGSGQERRHNDGRAAQMRDLVIGERVPNRARRGHSADRLACRRRPGSSKESTSHRSGTSAASKDSWDLAEVRRERIAEAQEVGAAMMIDDALRVASRARGVVERDRVPFVVRQFPGELRIAARDKILVFRFGKPRAETGKAGSA